MMTERLVNGAREAVTESGMDSMKETTYWRLKRKIG